jgi:Transposase DDE domain
MTTITELSQVMQKVLTEIADKCAEKTGFVQRKRVVTGSGFAQALVFGFMSDPSSTREDLNQAATAAGMVMSTPGLDKRFNAKAAYFLDSLLAEAVKETIECRPQVASLLSRFNGVYVGDSTTVQLPEALSSVFQGTNGETDAAAKVAVEWDVGAGSLQLWLSDGTVHDQRTGISGHRLPKGALRLNDLGFFKLNTFAQDALEGVFYFSRYKIGTLVYDPSGEPLDLARYLKRQKTACQQSIQLGADRLTCRLIALPVPPEQLGKRRKRLREIARRKQQPTSERTLALVGWTLYITNLPDTLLSIQEAAILGATRWQIECLFDLWKNEGKLDETRSQDPYRVWCEFYAKLLALLIQHWITVVGCWYRLDRSLHQAVQVIRKRAFAILEALPDLDRLIYSLQGTIQIMAHTCGRSKRKTQISTFQLWLNAQHG